MQRCIVCCLECWLFLLPALLQEDEMAYHAVCYVSRTRVGLVPLYLLHSSLSVTHMPACLRLWFQQSPPAPGPPPSRGR